MFLQGRNTGFVPRGIYFIALLKGRHEVIKKKIKVIDRGFITSESFFLFFSPYLRNINFI